MPTLAVAPFTRNIRRDQILTGVLATVPPKPATHNGGSKKTAAKKASSSGRQLPALGDPKDRAISARILKEIKNAKRILITGHERPDGDCVGSTVSLCGILRKQGFKASVLLDPIPERLQFLDRKGFAQQVKPGQKFDADLAIILDATEFERLGALNRSSFEGMRTINIDHHPSNRNFADLNWVDAKAAAAGELVWRLTACCGWKVPKAALEALYVALVTDTGQFAYSNTTPRILRMAAELIENGVDPEATWRRIYLNKDKDELALEARVRQSLEIWAGGKIASIALTQKDFLATGTSPEVTQEFVGIPRSLAGALLALFFYETDGGQATKVSIRSIREIDASALAQQFGGGGHHQAAGCSIPTPLKEAKRRFSKAAIAAVRKATR